MTRQQALKYKKSVKIIDEYVYSDDAYALRMIQQTAMVLNMRKKMMMSL
jgi:hypothetical protein